MAKRRGSKQLILEFFLMNLGTVVESKGIQAAGGGVVERGSRVGPSGA